MSANQDIAALLGNGVSIAFNPELALPRINDALRERFNASVPEGDPASVLVEAANKIDTGDPYTDFEALLGPLDQQYDFIQMVRQYAQIIAPSDPTAADHLQASAEFLRDIRRTGTSFALETIAARSAAYMDDREGLNAFIDALVIAKRGGRLTIANLNYDSLVLASLAERHQGEFCDLAWGYRGGMFEVLDGLSFEGHLLRGGADDFPRNRAIRLLHLHGSLTWLRNTEGQVYRFRASSLRDFRYWEKWRNDETDWQPVVVLTNQSAKTKLVTQEPYALAYSMTEEDFVKADRWLIAGYSFRDECVNAMLARAWEKRATPPDIMVIGFGADPSEDVVLRAIGYDPFVDAHHDPSTFLSIDRTGVESAIDGTPWSSWELPKRERAIA